MFLPGEVAAIDDRAAERGAVAAHELREGLHHNVRAVLDRPSRMGVATVLSTISGMPCLWATRASSSISQIFPAGLPTLSQKTARVLSSISFSIASG